PVEDNLEKVQISGEIESNSEQAIPQHLRKLRGGFGRADCSNTAVICGFGCCLIIIILVIILPLYFTGKLGAAYEKYSPG
ncbi:5216_t:CDS:1, partial [Cetraspora pellucida]